MVISLRRSLVAVGIALGVFLAIVWVGTYLSQAAASAAAAESTSPWAGVGPAILGFALTVLVALTLAIVTVAIGLRGRARRQLFTFVFAVVLIALAVVVWHRSGPALLAFPLVWAVPAASIGVIRWRWPAIALGAIGLAFLVVTVSGSLEQSREQQAIYDEYTGPIYVPSTSPGSPVEGYELRILDLPTSVRTDEISLLYTHETADGVEDSHYTIDFSETVAVAVCIGEFPDCGEIGTALGSPVAFDEPSGQYWVAVDGGVIVLKAHFDKKEDALAVLNDLRPATIEEFAALKLEPY